jgi:hypothetical protein
MLFQTLRFTGIAFANGSSGYASPLINCQQNREEILEKNIAFFSVLRDVEAALLFFGGHTESDSYIQKG